MPNIYGEQRPKATTVNPVVQFTVMNEPTVIVPSNSMRLSYGVSVATPNETLLLNYGENTLTTTTFAVLLQFGQSYFDDLFLGEVRAISLSGNAVIVNVTEFMP
ncbi:MAG: hypothetical protein ACPGVO_20840 [Spirulinaceae cyanobacterium]